MLVSNPNPHFKQVVHYAINLIPVKMIFQGRVAIGLECADLTLDIMNKYYFN